MPLYEYVARDGSVIERFAHMTGAPRFGSKVRVKGKTYTRIPSRPGGVKCLDVTHEATQFSQWIPGAPHYSPEGYPRFQNMREVREFQARYPRMRFDAD